MNFQCKFDTEINKNFFEIVKLFGLHIHGVVVATGCAKVWLIISRVLGHGCFE